MSLIVFTRKIIEPKREIVVPTKMSGRFRLSLMKRGRAPHKVLEFDNLITDGGLNRLGTTAQQVGGTNSSHFQIGSGNTAPAVTDTALASWLAGSNTSAVGAQVDTYFAGPPDYAEFSGLRRFAEGVGTGTIAEVGVGWAASGSLFSRALVVDGIGTPTTIEKLADDILDVEYFYRTYPPQDDVIGTINISGSSYDYVGRAAHVNSVTVSAGPWSSSYHLSNAFSATQACSVAETNVLGARTAAPTGRVSSGTNPPMLAYVDNSLQRDCTFNFSLSEANFASGLGAVCPFRRPSWDQPKYQFAFTPKIPKDNTKVLSLTFRQSWGRV